MKRCIHVFIYLFMLINYVFWWLKIQVSSGWLETSKLVWKPIIFLLIEIWNYEAINVFCMMKERLLFLQLSWSHSSCNCIFNDFPNLLKYDMNYKISFFLMVDLFDKITFLKIDKYFYSFEILTTLEGWIAVFTFCREYFMKILRFEFKTDILIFI